MMAGEASSEAQPAMVSARGEDSRLASFDDTHCQVERMTPTAGWNMRLATRARLFPSGEESGVEVAGAPACTVSARNCTGRSAGIHGIYASRAFFVQQLPGQIPREV